MTRVDRLRGVSAKFRSHNGNVKHVIKKRELDRILVSSYGNEAKMHKFMTGSHRFTKIKFIPVYFYAM